MYGSCKNTKYNRPTTPERFTQERELRELINRQPIINDQAAITPEKDELYCWFGIESQFNVKITKRFDDNFVLEKFFDDLLEIIFIPGFNLKHSLRVDFRRFIFNEKLKYFSCEGDNSPRWSLKSNFLTKIQLREWIQRFGINNFETVSMCVPENSSAACSIIVDDCQIKKPIVLIVEIQQQ